MSNCHSDQAPGHNKTYSIIVNGRPRETSEHKLSYIQLVQLGYPGEQPSEGVVFTVNYSNPHGNEGTLIDGDFVVVKDGSIFNVKKTDKS